MPDVSVVRSAAVPAPIGMYSNAYSVTMGAGDRWVIVAGQVALDGDGRLVGGDDFAGQCHQVYRNIQAVLEGAGATPDDLVSLRTYLTHEDDVAAFFKLREELYPTLFTTAQYPPNTLLVVRRLVRPEFKIEVEALACVK
jgi:2-iminobutanoate/2-iminopropanoate deaminase